VNTIHRYIARVYLINVLSLLVFLFGFIVVVDVFVNLRRFVDEASGGASDESPLRVMLLTALLVVDIWVPRLLQLFNYMGGVVLIGAMGFTCAQMVRSREFVALLASGVSLQSLTKPFLVVALLVTGVQIVNMEFVVPSMAHLLTRGISDSGDRSVRSFRLPPSPDGQERLISAARYIDEDQTLLSPLIYEREQAPDGTWAVRAVIVADSARWSGDRWELENGLREPVTRAATPGQTSRPVEPRTAEPVQSVESRLSPERIKVRYLTGLAENLSFRQLGSIIDGGGLSDEKAGALQRVRFGRYASLLAGLLTLLATLPCFLQRMPGPMIKPALRATPIALLGLGAAAAASTLPLPGLPDWLGPFVPGLIVLPLAIALYSSIKS
jgi:lipopolysaccharide export LptBFGC system permease protein LptF